MKAAMIMLVYAAALVLGGLYAFNTAPVGAAAKTALIVPGVCAALMIVCGVMATAIQRNRRVGMIGIHVGLVLPLLFAVAFAQRAWSGGKKLENYPAAVAAYEEASKADPGLTDPARRRAFFKERGAPEHDTTYLRNTLWALSGVSVVAFVALLAARPKRSERGAVAADE